MLEARDRRVAQQMRQQAVAINAGFDPGKDGAKIKMIKPVLEQDEDDDPQAGVQWWGDEEEEAEQG